uniref:ER membrane protein complex subunit 10 n=1 Tax=Chenopodium quinoa TaxID=63459 RepID=A0A803KMN6_CHEQI
MNSKDFQSNNHLTSHDPPPLLLLPPLLYPPLHGGDRRILILILSFNSMLNMLSEIPNSPMLELSLLVLNPGLMVTLTKLRFSRNTLTSSEQEKFKELLQTDDFYKIRLPSNVLSPPGRNYTVSAVKACILSLEAIFLFDYDFSVVPAYVLQAVLYFIGAYCESIKDPATMYIMLRDVLLERLWMNTLSYT